MTPLGRSVRRTILSLCFLLSARIAVGAELGMPAPSLNIAEWVKGNEVELKPGPRTNIVIVEFWATWCHPCLTTIPRLTALQRRNKDKGVVVVGISDEPASVVKPFVEGLGPKMNFTVAVDRDHKTAAAYLDAFGASDLPHAFLIDKSGAIVWHGHPLVGLDHALSQIIAGTYDLEAVKRALNAPKLIEDYLDMVSPDKLNPQAAELGNRIVSDIAGNPALLNDFAWTILTERRVTHRDLNLAVRASKAAVDATQGTDPSFLDTYARALADTGKIDDAIATEQKAIAASSDPKNIAAFKATLGEYQKKAAK